MKPLNLTTSIYSSLISLILSTAAHAASQCPLTNSAYIDIRQAANRLGDKVSLLSGGDACSKIEKDIEAAGLSVKTAIDELAKADAERKAAGLSGETAEAAGTQTQGAEKLKTAVDGLQALSGVFAKYSNDKNPCAQALLKKVDFFEAMINTVNGLAPYMLIYGGVGAAPVALGATLISGVAKSFLAFFKTGDIDMKDVKNRQIFIDAACAYHSFNDNYQALTQREAQLTQSMDTLALLKKELLEIESTTEPSVPTEFISYALIDARLKKNQGAIKSTVEVIQRFKDGDSAGCHFVRQRIEKGFLGDSIDDLQNLLRETHTKDPTIDTSSTEQILEIFTTISPIDRFDVNLPLTCGKRAQEWLTMAGVILERTESELIRFERRDRALSEKWKFQAKKLDKKLQISREEIRQNWLKKLGETGDQIENSDILQIRDQSRDVLFIDKSRKALFGLFQVRTKSPAESWLEQKVDQANLRMREYKGGRTEVLEKWIRPTTENLANPNSADESRVEACSQIQSLISTWETAKTHAAAGASFCAAFRYSINPTTYPRVSAFCFGKYQPDTKSYSGSQISACRASVDQAATEVGVLRRWLIEFRCPSVRPLEPSISL